MSTESTLSLPEILDTTWPRCRGMEKSFRHCTMLRTRPDGYGWISTTARTLQPTSVSLRAMIRPMSPEPTITMRFPGMHPSMFTRRWASPAVKIPAGRVPAMATLPLFLSLQPMARITAPAENRTTPWRLEQARTSRLPSRGLISMTVVSRKQSMPASATRPMNRSAYSGPVRSSPNSWMPNPLWMHCRRIPPRKGSRSTMAAVSPASRTARAAAMPALPPPITTAS